MSPALLAGLLVLSGCAAEPVALRGVILISLDTLRADRVGFHGYSRDTTPFLDRLAERGLVFEHTFAAAPWTAPSHAAMLTSMYPSVLGLGAYPRAGVVPQEAVSLAEHLAAAGFRTHAETAGGFLSARLGFAQGFERYEDRPRTLAQVVERGSAWLAQLAPEERFFLFLHSYDIHRYEPPRWARDQLVDAAQPPPDLADAHARAVAAGAHGLAELVQNPLHAQLLAELGPGSRSYLSQLYDASVRAADAQLERLWERLEALGLARNTLLIVTSDHGEELFDHGHTGHGFTLFDENLQVPLLVLNAGLAPRRVTRAVSLLDLAPTVSELLELAPPDAWQGRSLLAIASGDAPSRPVFAEAAHRPLRSVRDGPFKLIRRQDGGERLYDLRTDPGEQRELSSPDLAAAAELRDALDRWQRENGLQRLGPGARAAELDAALVEQLEALGYLDPPPPSDHTP